MHILVTGGAGYLGAVLVPTLLLEGHAVTVVDNNMYSGDSLLACCCSNRFKIIVGDIRDVNLVKTSLKNVDVIIPLAALVGQPICDDYLKDSFDINVNAISTIMKAKAPEQKVIFPSSQSCYGYVSDKTYYCDECSNLYPISQYAKAKVEAEKIVLEYDNTIVFRIATMFGASPRMRIDLSVNHYVYRALYDKYVVVRDGACRRNYVHVRDIANAYVFAINHFDKLKNNLYNVGNPNLNISSRQICQMIKNIIPDFIFIECPSLLQIDKRDYFVSSQKIENLGWHPVISLEQGITELIKAYALIKPLQYSNAHIRKTILN